MKYIYLLATLTLFTTSCTTLNESLQLGSALGALGGAAATYAGSSGAGKSPSMGGVALGAGVGLATGLLTSYFVHKKVDEDRMSCEADQTEMHFGDLPPSPFIVPKMFKKGGVKR